MFKLFEIPLNIKRVSFGIHRIFIVKYTNIYVMSIYNIALVVSSSFIQQQQFHSNFFMLHGELKDFDSIICSISLNTAINFFSNKNRL